MRRIQASQSLATAAPAIRYPSAERSPLSARRARTEIWLTLCTMMVTVLAATAFGHDLLGYARAQADTGHERALIHMTFIGACVFSLIASNIAYQVARLGYYKRLRHHSPILITELIQWSLTTETPPVTILTPAYKEDLRTMRQTLVTAALQQYPNRRVVLLLDNPPNPDDPGDAAELAAARQLPGEIMEWLREPATLAQQAAVAFDNRVKRGWFDIHHELPRLLALYDAIDSWFERQMIETPVIDHTDAQFISLAFHDSQQLLDARVQRLKRRLSENMLNREAFDGEYRFLADLFRVEITCFERKRFVNLSHEANKASNLNSYLGLIGRRVRVMRRADGLHIEPCDGDGEGVTIPDAAYVITLDADSLLAPEYALRLIHLMEQPENERLAIAQTPYTAIPHPQTLVERIAGSTTDVQYIANQGLTWAGATFWIGANAVLRKAALDEIAMTINERGRRVVQYIQDRTVIEDTESTIDLIAHGWELYNHLERLSYSATPADFGALLIQRRRWANGGLLIMPKLVRFGRQHRPRPRFMLELFMRANYLLAPFLSAVGMLGLILLSPSVLMNDMWLIGAAAPYYLLYGRDLVHAGYSWRDLPRSYAFNLMLLPINLAGALKSVEQAITGQKIPFGRTPKCVTRTAAPVWAVVAECALLLYCLGLGLWCLQTEKATMAVFSLTSALLFAYALVRFIGLREGVEDLRLSLKRQPRQAMSIAQPAETGNGISSSSADAPIDREAIYSWF